MMLGRRRGLGEGSGRKIVGAVAGATVQALHTPERPWLLRRDQALKNKTGQNRIPVLGILYATLAYLPYLSRFSVPSPQTV